MEKINENPFTITKGKGATVPLIISIPHVGTAFPSEVINDYLPQQVKEVDDTDWFLDQLYNFAPAMGITVIKANYSRWVIDLNRNPESKPLYTDGRIITGLTSTTDFLGKPIYKKGCEPTIAEVDRRLEAYYWPYYKAISNLLAERIAEFGNVVLWDAHSIRESVPTIQENKFPPMILGNADQTSADKRLINIALTELRKNYTVNHNSPFKGGHITRYFGNPTKHIHALQLERSKNLYMDDAERLFDEDRANRMRVTLKNTLQKLIKGVKLLDK